MALENKSYSGSKTPDEPEMDGKPLTDGSGVKFIAQDGSATGKNGDANVEIGNLPSQAPFAGMGKEELLKYANEPFWVRLRWALFILFWLAWIGMLAGAIALIITAPRCPPPPFVQWWQESPIYKIEPRTFLDSNEDGVGDLKGIESKLDYLKDLGIKTIMLGSIFSSTDQLGEEINDFSTVDSKIGTKNEMKELIAAVHDKGMRLILDFIPNHSSKFHPWFVSTEKKKYYYVWSKNPKPSNWKNKANNSAWTLDGDSYFYHKFNDTQPDLNWRNVSLIGEMEDILRQWLILGVDGFNMKDAQYLLENEEQNDELYPGQYTENHDDTFNLMDSWKEILNNYTGDRVLLVDVAVKTSELVKYYGNSTFKNGTRGADLVINEQLMQLKEGFTGFDLNAIVNLTMSIIPAAEWPSWVISDSSSGHVASRFSKTNLIDCFNALLLLLKGTPITYYGDEIGLIDNPDLSSGESSLTPMPWNNKANAGFTNGTSWLAPNPNYITINVQNQMSTEDPSHFNFYKRLVTLRSDPSIAYGNSTIKLVNEHLFSFLREAYNHPKYLTIINVKNESYTITSDDIKQSKLPPSGRLFLSGTTSRLVPSTSVTNMVNFEVTPLAVVIFKI